MKHIEIMRNHKSIAAIALAMMALTLTHCGSSGSNHASVAPVVPNTVQPNSVSVAPTAATSGDVLRITSINGTYAAAHAATVHVHPGDVIFLSADIFVASKNMAPAGANVESFIWSSSLSNQDTCDASQGLDCLKTTNFELSDYGVAFYVPYTMPENVQLSVRTNLSNEIDASGHPIFDVVNLHNLAFNGQPAVAPTIITDPANYVGTGSTLSPDTALAGLGHWVTVDNVRYFSPVSYVVQGETEWVPYRHGYWTWADQAEHGGWTWVSNDPWGWMTDHYGVWRHHANYGWLWLPFSDVHYEPHVVTFMDEGAHIGWVPYRENFNALYLHGAVEGFDDGYWGGMRGISEHFGEPNYLFHPGFAIINRGDLNRENMIDVVLNRGAFDSHLSVVITTSFSGNRFFGDHFEDHGFGRPTAVTSLLTFNLHGGGVFFAPHFLHPMPPESIGFVASIRPGGRPFGLGIVATFGVGGGAPRFLPPSSNGRVFVAPPLIRDAGGVPVGRLPMHTEHPAIIMHGNPIGTFHAPPAIAALPTNHIPQFNPRQKPAPDIIPVGAPRAGGPQGPQGGSRPQGQAPGQMPGHQPGAPQGQGGPQTPASGTATPSQPLPGTPRPVGPARPNGPAAPGTQPQQPGHTAPAAPGTQPQPPGHTAPAAPGAQPQPQPPGHTAPQGGTPAPHATPAVNSAPHGASPAPATPAQPSRPAATPAPSAPQGPTGPQSAHNASQAPTPRATPSPATTVRSAAPAFRAASPAPASRATPPAPAASTVRAAPPAAATTAATPRPQTSGRQSQQSARPRGLQNRPDASAAASSDDGSASQHSTDRGSNGQDSSARPSSSRCSSGQGDCSSDTSGGSRPRH